MMVRTVAILLLLGSAEGSVGATVRPIFCGTASWQSFIQEAADRNELPGAWVEAVIRAQSAGCTEIGNVPTTSTAGALGLMQLMPEVWNRFRVGLNLGTDPHDPHTNILAGVAYLRELYERYGYPGLFIAYHAGPGRYEDFLADARPLPRASLEYFGRILSELEIKRIQRRSVDARSNASTAVVRSPERQDSNSRIGAGRIDEPGRIVIGQSAPREPSGSLFVILQNSSHQGPSDRCDSRSVPGK